MIVKLLTERHLEFLSITGGCRGPSESTLVKMSNCWKFRALAQLSCCVTWNFCTGFGVCLLQSLYNSSGHLSNTQRHRMTIENLNLDGQVHTLFSENKTM